MNYMKYKKAELIEMLISTKKDRDSLQEDHMERLSKMVENNKEISKLKKHIRSQENHLNKTKGSFQKKINDLNSVIESKNKEISSLRKLEDKSITQLHTVSTKLINEEQKSEYYWHQITGLRDWIQRLIKGEN